MRRFAGTGIDRRPDDRRTVRVELTRSGRQTANRILRVVRSLERRALAGLTPDAVRSGRAILHALIEAEQR